MYIDLKSIIDEQAYPLNYVMKTDESLFADRGITLSDITVKGSYILSGGKVYVEAAVFTDISYACDKCLAACSSAVKIPLNEVFEAGGEYTYENNIIELKRAARDVIVLSVPQQLLCKEECKGLCPKCGCDKNTENCCCEQDDGKNPFAILKSITGGAKNGSTKK